MAGMWVVHIEVKDAESYGEYLEGSTRVVAEFDGEFIARGGRYEQKEGKEFPRNVIVRFPTYDRAVEAYESDDYQAIVGIAKAAAERFFIILETDD